MKSDKLVLIGGDSRRSYTEEYLNECGYKTIDFQSNMQDAVNELKKNCATVILPLPVSRNGRDVNISDPEIKLSFKELGQMLKKGDRVFGGMVNDEFSEMLFDKGVKVIDYYDEQLIIKNAYFTALGLKEVIKENLIDIKKAETAVTGFGRTAKEIAKYLTDEKCSFYITARSDDAIKLAKSMNYNAVKLNNFTDKVAYADLIINTVPAQIIDKKTLSLLKSNTLIIDIASYPFGVDYDLAGQYGIKVIRALSLPGKYTPQLAGKAIGEKIKCLL